MIPPDKNVAVGDGAKDFLNSLSIIVHQHALKNVETQKDVRKIIKERIVANALVQMLHFLCF